ncbi:MAG: type II secretion system protein, partial [Ruminococcus sp.]|nr:type II secretion system protein [Ruminococcus sp.]
MRIKKTQKGFTLIELIIVMAIFGIIMLGVMKIADPLARVMSRSSVKEQSAANVDNISDYLDHSLRYAKYMSVYEGELPDSGYSNTEAMVKDFVTAFY